MQNATIELLLNHRSIRKFKKQPLTDDQINLLVACAQAASTSSFTQSYSIIGVEDPSIKKQLSEISDQPYVDENGYFFVFVADQYRNKTIGDQNGADTAVLDTTQRLIVALGDAAFAAQNMAVAAESMGLGICYIGSIQRDIDRTAKLLKLPEYTFPVFGLAVGYPDQRPEKKPRLPRTSIFHKNQYNAESRNEELNEYDRRIEEYYHTRSGGQRKETWTGQITRGLGLPARMALKPFLEKQHLGRR
ncbi:oxygen-insensitive NADPH nitroreductase [Sporolactobacillus sp. CPB3-1]|uniref:Oxygen-insensitive NADPH nitroreductase n=1 Tax=Sporolactobacillus mangiferae TaxID=2940498 RepID=A0ABT0M8L7_9BACL|nr:oxygen-insensitive NADPH nitroreductase [Sporolactobacillus mangiferae]MCL1631212.1 oxygen-insensitive NADPH nitroreductase [Sporolactobacillus mangiferae]